MPFNNADSIRSEIVPTEKGQDRLIFIFLCQKCQKNEVRIHVGTHGVTSQGIRRMQQHFGWCNSCRKCRFQPFYTAWKSLLTGAERREIPVLITFEDFLVFTKIPNCHYCLTLIPWQPRHVAACFLDRKENKRGYEQGNLVVCCSMCNQIKGARLTYEEMLILQPSLIELAKHRLTLQSSLEVPKQSAGRKRRSSPTHSENISKALKNFNAQQRAAGTGRYANSSPKTRRFSGGSADVCTEDEQHSVLGQILHLACRRELSQGRL